MVNVLQRQKVLRRPEQVSRTNNVVITAKTAALPAFISFKPLAFLTSLLDGFGFKELILSAGVVISLLLFYQHLIVKPNNLSRVNLAFFTTNGVASVLFMVFYLLEVFFPVYL